MTARTLRLGPYELRGELGRGAMARVWRAWDPKLEREVAIKEPLFDANLTGAIRDELGKRFVAEGRTAARLNHANIVTIFAADVWDGRPAIVMELIDGTTLASLLRTGSLDPREAVSILDQLLDAVGYAHEHGVVHRDIKPDNIFVDKSGRVKLADFGIAHAEGSARTNATVAGAVLGTPGYMSPEQARGAAVDARSDLFSVGVVGYELLSGKNPFGAGTGIDATTLLYRIVHEPVPELHPSVCENLPIDVRPAIMAALEKDPAARPQTAGAFKAMLHGVPQTRRTAVAPRTQAGAADTPKAAGKRTGTPSWLPYAAAALVAAVVLLGVFFSASRPAGGGGAAAAAASQEQASAADVRSEQSADAAVEAADIDADAPEQESAAATAPATEPASVAAPAAEAPVGNTPPVFTQASASSYLSGVDDEDYGPWMAIDGNPETAWNVRANSGVGEWIELSSDSLQRVSSIEICAGYNWSEEGYWRNYRPRDIEISLAGGISYQVTLEDAYYSYQTINLPEPVDTAFVRITILSNYDTSERFTDSAISEIRVS